jgi:SpoVK/Ycf46/Vps4 family AAA+-type ATPase
MDKVKQQVQSFIHYVQLQQLRQEQGLTTNPISLHLAFVGPPGTGKTTVARLLGRAFKAMGILPSGHFVEANREKLVAGYVGQTAIKTKELIDQAEGGVLFIDEAYALSSKQADSSDYGKEAVATLIEAMETKKDRMAVIFAGYPQEMDDFFQSNSGLRSRVKNFFEFNHYTPKELEAIFQRFCQEEQFSLTPEAEQKLNRVLKSVFDGKDSRTFGNGRVVRNFFEDAKQNMGNRISVLETKGEPITKEMLTTFQSEDIPGFQGKSRGLVKAWKKVFHGTQE